MDINEAKLIADYYGLYVERDLKAQCYVLSAYNGTVIRLPYNTAIERLRALCEAWEQ